MQYVSSSLRSVCNLAKNAKPSYALLSYLPLVSFDGTTAFIASAKSELITETLFQIPPIFLPTHPSNSDHLQYV